MDQDTEQGMKRRTFLKATLATAGTLVVGGAAGCGDDGGGPDGGGDTGGDDTGGGDTGGGDTGGDDAGGGDTGGDPVVYEPGDRYFPQSLASGDPKAASVILWTRLEDSAHLAADVELQLHVAADADFTQRVTLDGGDALTLTAAAAFDHCVKVRVEGLDPGSHYWFRFVYAADDGLAYSTKIARTKTAAAPDADVPVRFAFVSCQDYGGRYYNTHRRMALEDDLDFFVCLGDYVYETAGDPLFQQGDGTRDIYFSDQDAAIAIHAGTEDVYYAARALSNYRDLYKIYRTDPHLQRLHELYPMIVIWDDHEFSDDSHGQTATYFDGAQDELDPERRQNADQAWFEYMPVDYAAGPDFVYDPAVAFPDDLKIYRDFRFGQHVHLVMTDLRRYRADHLIPEDAFPGSVAVTDTQLQATLGAVPDGTRPYVEIDTFDGGSYAQLLADHAEALGLVDPVLTGATSVDYLNGLVAALNEAGANPPAAPIDDADPTLPRGFAWHHAFKTGRYSSLGSRYLVVAPVFDAIAAVRWEETGGASELVLGDTQRQWFLDTMSGSTATWKLWGNEFTLMPRMVDLTTAEGIPDSFKQRFHVSVEDWEGLPHRRDQILGELAGLGNVVAITGDIHAFLAGTPWVTGDPSQRIVELVGSSLSSAPMKRLLLNQASADPDLVAAGAVALAYGIETLMLDTVLRPNPWLAHLVSDHNGFVVVDVDGAAVEATMYAIEEKHVSTEILDPDDELDALFVVERFRVDAGVADLKKWFEADAAWKTWDPEAMAWM